MMVKRIITIGLLMYLGLACISGSLWSVSCRAEEPAKNTDAGRASTRADKAAPAGQGAANGSKAGAGQTGQAVQAGDVGKTGSADQVSVGEGQEGKSDGRELPGWLGWMLGHGDWVFGIWLVLIALASLFPLRTGHALLSMSNRFFGYMFHANMLACVSAVSFLFLVSMFWPPNALAGCGFVLGYVLFYAVRHTTKSVDGPLIAALAAVLGGGFLQGYVSGVYPDSGKITTKTTETTKLAAPSKGEDNKKDSRVSDKPTTSQEISKTTETSAPDQNRNTQVEENTTRYGEGILLGFSFYFVVTTGIVALSKMTRQEQAKLLAQAVLGIATADVSWKEDPEQSTLPDGAEKDGKEGDEAGSAAAGAGVSPAGTAPGASANPPAGTSANPPEVKPPGSTAEESSAERSDETEENA